MLNNRKWFVLVSTALLLMASVAVVSAAPTAPVAPNNIPATAAYINGQTQSVAGDSSLWYKFDYNGDKNSDTGRLPVTLTLPNGALDNMSFEVYAPSQIADWWDETPVGRGTAQHMFDDGVPAARGPDVSPDLTWVGRFPESGTYYVRVDNNNNDASNFALMIQGIVASLSQ